MSKGKEIKKKGKWRLSTRDIEEDFLAQTTSFILSCYFIKICKDLLNDFLS